MHVRSTFSKRRERLWRILAALRSKSCRLLLIFWPFWTRLNVESLIKSLLSLHIWIVYLVCSISLSFVLQIVLYCLSWKQLVFIWPKYFIICFLIRLKHRFRYFLVINGWTSSAVFPMRYIECALQWINRRERIQLLLYEYGVLPETKILVFSIFSFLVNAWKSFVRNVPDKRARPKRIFPPVSCRLFLRKKWWLLDLFAKRELFENEIQS